MRTGAVADYPTMIDATAGGDVRAGLSALMDDLEFHRAFDVEDRLARAVRLGQQAFAVGAIDLQMRGRLVESDMRLRIGQATEAAHLATEVNHWAREHGPPALLARSHLILSSIFESIGDSASCLDNALKALELLDDDTPERTRGNFLVRLADALSVAGSFDAARQRYREAEQHFVAIGDTERRVSALNNLAYAEYEAGDSKRAWDAAQEMRSVAEGCGYVLTPPLLDTLARAHIGMGEYDQAAAVLEEALRAVVERGDIEADTPAGVLLTMAEVQLRQGRLELAQATLEDCRSICEERNLGSVLAEVLRVQAELLAAAGRFDQAYEIHKAFHAEFVRLNSMTREADARTRQALFETAEARHSAERFWRQARTDALTGLPNRRFVDEEVPRLLERSGQSELPLVAAIVDADDFKRINDTLSHEVGDRVIRELAHVLQQALAARSGSCRGGLAVRRPPGRRGVSRFAPRAWTLPARPGCLRRVRGAVAGHEWGPLIGDLPLR